jgi:hypothetical protein
MTRQRTGAARPAISPPSKWTEPALGGGAVLRKGD